MGFAPIPAVPQGGLTDAEFRMFSAVKQNLDQLIGTNGEAEFIAMLTGQVTVQPVGALNSSLPNLTGQAALTSGGIQVPLQTDFVALAATVQQLVADVQKIRNTLDTLVDQLDRGII